jgi:hypothetical protein
VGLVILCSSSRDAPRKSPQAAGSTAVMGWVAYLQSVSSGVLALGTLVIAQGTVSIGLKGRYSWWESLSRCSTRQVLVLPRQLGRCRQQQGHEGPMGGLKRGLKKKRHGCPCRGLQERCIQIALVIGECDSSM